jgi:hypothetical protein
MPLYELRTYTLRVGAMAEAVKLYQEIGFPALQKGKHDKKLVGYFQADTGTINQLLHLWKFDDDADRRAHWAAVYANKDFVEGFAVNLRPLLITQEVKLLREAPCRSCRTDAKCPSTEIPVSKYWRSEWPLRRRAPVAVEAERHAMG